MAEIKLSGYQCERCGHKWTPRIAGRQYETKLPLICPKCKSASWNIPGDKK